ncbi:NAD(P)H-dependent flavin oxidoreductase [Peribacillus frigoritolerans]|uniref:NAD(P)H-dependent flavin oxidoreductase n=1 Tax=Peribacillus frigoritolerans TaxID=450367 RepID=UPI0037F21BC1
MCSGAGGHGGTLNPIAFMGDVKKFWNGITILSGCISYREEILAAEVLCAHFAYRGTCFIATAEFFADEEYQNMLIEYTVDDIIYTNAISGVNCNFLVPSIRNVGLDPFNFPKKHSIDVVHDQSDKKAWKNIWAAGQGVGSIKQVQTISQVVEELKQEYDYALPSLLVKHSK